MGVQFIQNDDASAGMQGVDLDKGPFVFINIPYTSASPLAMSGCVAGRALTVRYINVVPDVVSTNAVTAQVFAAGSTVALASGTVLHSGTANLQGTASGNQFLPVTAPTVRAGSRIGVVISGALGAAGSGVVSIVCNPL